MAYAFVSNAMTQTPSSAAASSVMKAMYGTAPLGVVEMPLPNAEVATPKTAATETAATEAAIASRFMC